MKTYLRILLLAAFIVFMLILATPTEKPRQIEPRIDPIYDYHNNVIADNDNPGEYKVIPLNDTTLKNKSS